MTFAWLAAGALPLGGVACGVEIARVSLPAWVAVPLLAVVLKPTFAWRMLHTEVAAVERAAAGGVAAARAQLARLVSRDVNALDGDTVRETAIETLAENLNDSVVAPLFWYAVAGLTGAVIYRFANSTDAMWGYRGAREWAGKWKWKWRWAARAEDVLSWLPARITAALLWLVVRLRKPGGYALNGAAPSPTPAPTARALQAASSAAQCAMVGACAVWLMRAVLA